MGEPRAGLWWTGVLGPIAFIASWIVAGSLRAGYDPANDAISRLAELGAQRRWVVLLGMVTFGVCCIAFAATVVSLPTAVRALLLLAGISSLGAALFPCSRGCPGWGTTTDDGHILAAGIHYVSFTGAAIVAGLRSPGPRYRSWSVGLGLAAAACLGLHVLAVGPNGAMQRVGLILVDLWLVITAVRARTRPLSGGPIS